MGITAQLKNAVRTIMERFPKVSTAYCSARDGLQIYEAPKVTPMGFRMVGNHMMQAGEFEVTEVSFVKQLFNHTNVFINVGANVGFYCCHALQNIKNNHWEHEIEIFL